MILRKSILLQNRFHHWFKKKYEINCKKTCLYLPYKKNTFCLWNFLGIHTSDWNLVIWIPSDSALSAQTNTFIYCSSILNSPQIIFLQLRFFVKSIFEYSKLKKIAFWQSLGLKIFIPYSIHQNRFHVKLNGRTFF